MHLIASILLSGSLYAKTVEINYRNFNYKIDYNEKEATYTAPHTELSLKAKECNKHILKEFKSKMDAYLRGDFLTKSTDQSYSLTIDNSKKYDLLISKRGIFFSNFDNYFKTLKVEEKLNCK